MNQEEILPISEEQEEIFDLLYPDIEKAVEKKIIN